MAEPRDPFDLAGVTIDGKYRVASVIGDGGFGVVYRGVHKGFGELIAIKCLKLPGELDEKARADFLERLQDEGRLLHRLSKASSGIVQALDVGAFTTPAGTWVPYLVLEWLEGETLGEFLKDRAEHGDGGLAVGEAIRLLEPVARALGVAHAQKVAHRDVKPANIFLTDVAGKRTTKVLDFGIAKVLSDQGTFTTALESTGVAPTAFTPRYGAPEQFNKQRGATGPWTDVFALALVLVECVSGRRALEGDDPTQLYIASADPALRPTFRRRGVDVSEQIEQVIEKALEVEPRNRYDDATEFWAALEKAVGLEGTATASGRGSRSSGPVTEVDNEPMMDTGEYALKKSLKVDANLGKSGVLGPTMPVESMRDRSTARDRKGAGRSSRADDDPMAETPEGERISRSRISSSDTKSTSVTKPSETREGRSWLGIIGTVVALGLFVGGLAFAYTTFFAGDPGAKKLPPSAKASGGPTSAPSQHALPPGTTKPSAVASIPSPHASGAPSSSPSASPSADASAAVSSEPPPEDMVRIKAATFSMGEKGIDTTITKDFFLDKYEVSVRAYKECFVARKCPQADTVLDATAADPDKFSQEWSARCNARGGNSSDAPMNCVDAIAAQKYCEWKGKRLPTEAEWELAARGTEGRKYSWGANEPECAQACFDKNGQCLDAGNAVRTCLVGKHSDDKTPDSIFDLAGDVSEWTSDGFGDLKGGKDPRGPAGGERVVRGGSFLSTVDQITATTRRSVSPKVANVEIGFRCAADVKSAP